MATVDCLAKLSKIFVIDQGKVRTVESKPFRDLASSLGTNLEDALQVLLANYPEVFPGWEIDPANPTRFVMLGREIPVGDWRIDLLLVDQDGVLTLVETKLKENRESRREVVGQIVEYAAHASEHLANGKARTFGKDYWLKERGKNLDEVVAVEFANEGVDPLEAESFWTRVEDNLKEGRVRLIIAADEIRPEVRKDIEYLNAEMENAWVFGLEVQAFAERAGLMIVVPSLVGQTQTIIDSKQGNKPKTWSIEDLKESVQDIPEDIPKATANRLLDWVVKTGRYMPSGTIFPGFSVRSNTGRRLASVSLSTAPHAKSFIFCYLTPETFQGGIEERNQFFSGLQSLGLIANNLTYGR